jgi:hypothetical protein
LIDGLILLATWSLLTEQHWWAANELPSETNSSKHPPSLVRFRLEDSFFAYIQSFLSNLYSFSKNVKLSLSVCMLFILVWWCF